MDTVLQQYRRRMAQGEGSAEGYLRLLARSGTLVGENLSDHHREIATMHLLHRGSANFEGMGTQKRLPAVEAIRVLLTNGLDLTVAAKRRVFVYAMFTASGTLRYSPKRQESSQHWWLILDCDPALGQYYRHLYQQTHHQCRKLARPFWGPHVTIVRNEEPDDAHKHLWNLHAGEEIEFQYSGGIKDNYSEDRYRSFYWLDVVCPRLLELRRELGLPDPFRDFHLTIGSWENPARRDWYLNEFRTPL